MISEDDIDEGIASFPTVQSSIKKYDSEFQVSRDVFKFFELDSKPFYTPRQSTQVFSRLFDDFTRRQEAKTRLSAIVDLKKRKTLQDSLHIPNFNETKINRSLSKPEVRNMIQRLNKFWEKKWDKIEKRKKQIAEAEAEEFKKIVRVKSAKKTDPAVFNRLISPRVLKKKPEPQAVVELKKFSIKEAIESGKRLMKSRKFVSSKEPSPSKIERNGLRDIEDIIRRFKKRGSCRQSKSFRFEISPTQTLSFIPKKF